MVCLTFLQARVDLGKMGACCRPPKQSLLRLFDSSCWQFGTGPQGAAAAHAARLQSAASWQRACAICPRFARTGRVISHFVRRVPSKRIIELSLLLSTRLYVRKNIYLQWVRNTHCSRELVGGVSGNLSKRGGGTIRFEETPPDMSRKIWA